MALKQILHAVAGSPSPRRLRRDLQKSDDPDVVLRRAVVGASAVGLAAMTAVTFYQSGLVKKLPGPPVKKSDSNAVNASAEAYSYGTPDAPLSIMTHASSIFLATLGGRKRAKKAPWLSLAATVAAAPAAITAVRYLFYQMPVKEKRWCGYCIVDALAHIAAFSFTLRETGKAGRNLLTGNFGRSVVQPMARAAGQVAGQVKGQANGKLRGARELLQPTRH